MRTHRKYSQFVLWRDAANLRELVQLPHLALARVEPVVRGLRGGAMMDLVFHSAHGVAVIPCIEIVPEMLVQREMSPFVWPHDAASGFADGVAGELERALLPWIESLTLARQLNAETSRSFAGGDAAHVITSAREAGFIGASPYGTVLEKAAPYAYAVRFAENARAAIRDSHGALGAAMLRAHAREICVDFGSEERRTLAERWYGGTFSALNGEGGFDLSISDASNAIDASVRVVLGENSGDRTHVDVATPVPTDVMVSYDPHDAAACGSFTVRRTAPNEPRPAFIPARPQAAGGSSGRILFVLREDCERAPDADSDEACALASLLRAEGFSVDLVPASRALPAQYDLVHAFTLARVNELFPALQAARASAVPVVVSPMLHDICAQGAWGTGIIRALLRVSTDETDLQDNLQLLSQRRLDAPGLSSKHQEPFAGYENAVRQALGIAGAVVSTCAAEESLVRRFGFTGPIVNAPPAVFASGLAAAETPVAGDFVLSHVPIEARSNVLLLVRAAVSARLPLILAGPVTDPEYALAVKEQAGDRVVFAAEPDAAAAEAMYRGATVFADVAWVRFGLHRLMRAAASGAALVAPTDAQMRSRLGSEAVWEVDPASQDSIETGLRDAWMHAREQRGIVAGTARRAGSLVDPRAALVAAVQAYACAQRPSTPA
ncbi:MAG TPA: hypothetical protein VIO32_04375 [Candidatus Baltobacteraceae bacterium]